MTAVMKVSIMKKREHTDCTEFLHRIKNNLTVIKGLLCLQSNSIDNPEATKAFKVAIARIDTMGVLYEKLYITENAYLVNSAFSCKVCF